MVFDLPQIKVSQLLFFFAQTLCLHTQVATIIVILFHTFLFIWTCLQTFFVGCDSFFFGLSRPVACALEVFASI